MQNGKDDTKLSPKETAALLHVSVQSLRTWRVRKCGPRYYRKVGRIFYLKSDVEAWELSQPSD